jgi:hypothetical protein
VQHMAGDQPVEEMAQRRELLLDALGLVGTGLQLYPGRDMHGLDVEEINDPGGIFGPAQEVPHGPQVGFTGVAVPDLGGEELDEPLLGVAPGAPDQRRHPGRAVPCFQKPRCSRHQLACHARRSRLLGFPTASFRSGRYRQCSNGADRPCPAPPWRCKGREPAARPP